MGKYLFVCAIGIVVAVMPAFVVSAEGEITKWQIVALQGLFLGFQLGALAAFLYSDFRGRD